MKYKQCIGVTKKGTRCKIHRDISKSGFCKYHKFQEKYLKSKRKTSLNKRLKYYKYLESPAWQKKRNIVFSKLGKTCKLCGNYGNTVHHNNYASVGHEDPLKDLTVLCKKCHKEFHKKKDK